VLPPEKHNSVSVARFQGKKKERAENFRSRRSRWRELCLGLYQGFELDFAVDDFHDVFHFAAIFLGL
jgi:hypothetical protein